ncbi:MAG: molybdenum cofactor guanylyltransferase [Dehalococcoidia bacterium]
MTGIVLAGGRSGRLGRDKAGEVVLGRSLLQRVVDKLSPVAMEVVVVTAPGRSLPPIAATLPWRRVEDVFPGQGPLAGIYAGLLAAGYAHALAVACDMPLLSVPLLRYLLSLRHEADVVLPMPGGLADPLHAVYSRRCLEPIQEVLEAGWRRPIDFLGAVAVRYVSEEELNRFDPHRLSFFNVNTEADLARARAELERSPAR